MLRVDCHHNRASSGAFLGVNGLGAATLPRAPVALERSRQHHKMTVSFHLNAYCAEDQTNRDQSTQRQSKQTRNAGTGLEACARGLGRKKQWDNWTRGYSDVEYVSIAKVEMEIGKAHCDRYSQ